MKPALFPEAPSIEANRSPGAPFVVSVVIARITSANVAKITFVRTLILVPPLIIFTGFMVLPVSPRSVTLVVGAGPEETKNLAGGIPPPDSDPFSDAEFEKILPACQAQPRYQRESQLRVPEAQSAFHRRAQPNAFRHRVCNPGCSPVGINR
jgi:hypothetical protein